MQLIPNQPKIPSRFPPHRKDFSLMGHGSWFPLLIHNYPNLFEHCPALNVMRPPACKSQPINSWLPPSTVATISVRPLQIRDGEKFDIKCDWWAASRAGQEWPGHLPQQAGLNCWLYKVKGLNPIPDLIQVDETGIEKLLRDGYFASQTKGYYRKRGNWSADMTNHELVLH